MTVRPPVGLSRPGAHPTLQSPGHAPLRSNGGPRSVATQGQRASVKRASSMASKPSAPCPAARQGPGGLEFWLNLTPSNHCLLANSVLDLAGTPGSEFLTASSKAACRCRPFDSLAIQTPILLLRCPAPPGLVFDLHASTTTWPADRRTSSESGADAGAACQGGSAVRWSLSAASNAASMPRPSPGWRVLPGR
jgi:hypothetical protein